MTLEFMANSPTFHKLSLVKTSYSELEEPTLPIPIQQKFKAEVLPFKVTSLTMLMHVPPGDFLAYAKSYNRHIQQADIQEQLHPK